MTHLRFLVQRLDTGLYAAPVPCVSPYTPHPELAASYTLQEGIEVANRIRQRDGASLRLVEAHFRVDGQGVRELLKAVREGQETGSVSCPGL